PRSVSRRGKSRIVNEPGRSAGSSSSSQSIGAETGAPAAARGLYGATRVLLTIQVLDGMVLHVHGGCAGEIPLVLVPRKLAHASRLPVPLPREITRQARGKPPQGAAVIELATSLRARMRTFSRLADQTSPSGSGGRSSIGIRTTSSRLKIGTVELVGCTIRPRATSERISLIVWMGWVRRISWPDGVRGGTSRS